MFRAHPIKLGLTLFAYFYLALQLNAQGNTSAKWVDPFEVVSIPVDASALGARLGADHSMVSLDGDTLTIVHRESAEHVRVTGTFQRDMIRVSHSDIWILQLKKKDWNKAFFSYAFYSGQSAADLKDADYMTWRGPDAPELLRSVEKLRGKILERTIHSKILSEDRRVSVYLPLAEPKDSNIPVIFMADGEDCESYARVLEPLIAARIVRPIAIIGIHSAAYRGDKTKPFDISLDFRVKEYLPGFDPSTFDKHMRFFTVEAVEWAAKEFGLSRKRMNHVVFGTSNGGYFAAAAGAAHPDVFAYSMPFSLGIPPADAIHDPPFAMFAFAVGELDSFSVPTKDVEEQMKALGAKTSYHVYVSGHDPLMWKIAFLDVLRNLFPQLT